jgi:glyoxylase-like metal-dependent hydrolase (beta-lactamase superfamily II)/ketosteroid isomerase-like protein
MAEQQSPDPTSAATKVQEAAAAVQATTARRRRPRISGNKAEAVVRRYFAAIDARDLQGAVALWAQGGREHVHGRLDALAPHGVEEFIGELVGAIPDLKMEVLSSISEGDRCGVHWRLTGTFAGPGSFGGVAPTGNPIDIEGFDLLTVRDGLIESNEAFTDSMTFARQVGMMPPLGSSAEQRMMGAFNTKTRLTARLIASEPQLVAEGVWVVQGQPGRCNVYLIEDEGGVTLYDAGARTMTRAVAQAGATMGGIKRVVLGHGHTDHRGTAPALGAPVLCHPAEREDAEGSGGFRYWPEDLAGLPMGAKQLQKILHRLAFDGGPVTISDTLTEGDEIAGFKVIELPGHAPGLIGLWRESDRLALVSDCVYTIDMWGRHCAPSVPDETYNYDTEQARESIRKLAEMEPAVVWTGHGKPVTGDVRSQLLAAAGGSPADAAAPAG